MHTPLTISAFICFVLPYNFSIRKIIAEFLSNIYYHPFFKTTYKMHKISKTNFVEEIFEIYTASLFDQKEYNKVEKMII